MAPLEVDKRAFRTAEKCDFVATYCRQYSQGIPWQCTRPLPVGSPEFGETGPKLTETKYVFGPSGINATHAHRTRLHIKLDQNRGVHPQMAPTAHRDQPGFVIELDGSQGFCSLLKLIFPGRMDVKFSTMLRADYLP